MPNSRAVLRDYFRPLLDQPAWHGVAAYGSWLRLNFGEPHLVVREPVPGATHRAFKRRDAYVKGTHQLWIEMGAWTMRRPGKQVVHSESTRRQMEQAIVSVEGQILVDVVCSNKPLNTIFLFDGGCVLEVYSTGDASPDEPLWHFYSGSRMLQLLAGGDLRYGQITRNAPFGRRLDDGSNPTFQRTAPPPLN